MHENRAQRSDRARVLYLGSGVIGLPVIESLLRDVGIDIVGIATQIDRPAGRRRRPAPTPVAAFAASRGLQARRVPSVNARDFLDWALCLNPHMVLVFSFGQMLGQELLDLPQFGCLNVHASLLPRHRGAAPVAAAIIAGDRETGVSFMEMESGLDTGPVYEKHALTMADDETADQLESRLGRLAAGHIVRCVRRVVFEECRPVAQDDRTATYAPKLRKRDGLLDWSGPAEVAEKKVRAFTPWPRVTFCVDVGGKKRHLQITQARSTRLGERTRTPGEVLQADGNGWVVACGQGALRLMRVIPEGRKEMAAADFLRGTPIDVGTCLRGANSGGPGSTGDETNPT